MNRREFIALLGGAAAGWPIAATAQQAVPVVGFLRSASLADAAHLVAAFRQGLKEAGYIEGQNVAIEFRSAEGQADRLPGLVADLIGRHVAVIVGNVVAAVAAKAATATVPIVFATGSDPVKDGLVASLNRPGGNVTGVSFLGSVVGAKRLDLLRQLVPKTATIAFLGGPDSADVAVERRDVQAAAQAVGQQLINFSASGQRDLDAAFEAIIQGGAGGLFAGGGAFMYSHRERIVAFAAQNRLPAIYVTRESPAAGGLMSYGASIGDAYRQAGIYAGRILKGDNPADIPVIQSTKFEFVINLKTAKALGLEFHPQLLATADEVIE
jgi:putative ABC transport system substrate-binding protein